ncbi:dddD [Symbiodinium sp. CCMP2592]|nr:dddD [Symbiodinium sp. CCMP2592]
MDPERERPRLPYAGIRILEKACWLTGRLAGLLFADQGAEVLVLECDVNDSTDVDPYLNRNKITASSMDAISMSSIDIIIVDGDDNSFQRLPHQILLRTVVALPGDPVFGHLSHDIDEDYLSALTGFFTNMDMMGWLDRPATYTPLKLCSIYAAVIGANACAAALVDRLRCGKGREIHASRLAAGLSAIGALCLKQTGLPKHLDAVSISHHRSGLPADLLKKYKQAAIADPGKQVWLFQRLYPFMAPYRCKDGNFILPMATFNRRLAVGFCRHLGFVDAVEAAGIVDKDPYDPTNMPFDECNLALPMGLDFQKSSKCAELFASKFMEKTAKEWEEEFETAGLPCAEIQSFQDWMQDKDARMARIVADVEGLPEAQLGRTAWLKSAGDYPALRKMERNKKVEFTGHPSPADAAGSQPKPRPLDGYVVVDFANVIAGPAAGRMFGELGATVYKVGPGLPQHAPMVMMVWQAELHQGKKSIIINHKKEGAQEIVRRLVARADIVLINKMDDQLQSLGLDRETLDKVNRRTILLQLKAHSGEKPSARSNWTGYDPALQGKVGLMTRFGPPGCPNFHGVASCVDYLTGYMATFAGVAALYSREVRQSAQGDWASTSLAVCASLTQFTLQKHEPPASALGASASGMTSHSRIFKVKGGKSIYGQADPAKADADALAATLASMDVEQALAHFKSSLKSLAVPVQTCGEMAALCSDGQSTTAHFKRKDAGQGWVVETWEPTWFCFDGRPVSTLWAPTRAGSDAPQVLAELGYSTEEVSALKKSGAVVPTNWYKWEEEMETEPAGGLKRKERA